MALFVHAGRRRLPGDGHQRRAIHIGVGHAGDQVGGAWSQSSQAHAGTAGEPAIHVGHEGRSLLVARGDETDAALRQRIHDVDVLFPRNAEDVVHALVFQAAYQELSCVHARCLALLGIAAAAVRALGDGHRLDVDELADAVTRQLAPIAGTLHATKG
jgi:hypothetical protein